jgi:hypothetical protein
LASHIDHLIRYGPTDRAHRSDEYYNHERYRERTRESNAFQPNHRRRQQEAKEHRQGERDQDHPGKVERRDYDNRDGNCQ